MANLQRLPGSSAQMKIMPVRTMESDIQISRHLARNWQAHGWMMQAVAAGVTRPVARFIFMTDDAK